MAAAIVEALAARGAWDPGIEDESEAKIMMRYTHERKYSKGNELPTRQTVPRAPGAESPALKSQTNN